MKKLIKATLFLLLCAFSVTNHAQKEVIVGGYEFPPFISLNNGRPSGMTLDLINILNNSQQKYIFKFKLTTSKERYRDFNQRKYDFIFFENIIWGWHDEPIRPSRVILNGGEVFIAKAASGRDQKYFDSLKDKALLGIQGYHYKFANFVTSKEYLQKYFNMELGTSHDENIKSVISREQPTIAIVTKSYINLFLNQNPKLRKSLIVSKKLDQTYRHTILGRVSASPTIGEVNDLIEKLKANGKLEFLWKRYGIK